MLNFIVDLLKESAFYQAIMETLRGIRKEAIEEDGNSKMIHSTKIPREAMKIVGEDSGLNQHLERITFRTIADFFS